MKKLTRLLSLALAILMVMSLAGAAFAVDPETTITITQSPKGAQYKFYRVLDMVQNEQDPNKVVYSVPDKYRTALQAVTGKTDDDDIIKYIEGQNTANLIRKFADQLYDQISSLDADNPTTVAADSTTNNASFTGPYGYYLIAQTAADAGEAYSLVMLDTGRSGGISIAAKVDKPSHIKNLKETNDTEGTVSEAWQNGADYDIGDRIPFRITAYMTRRIDDYSPYKLIFHDKPSDGLAFSKADASIAVKLIHMGETPQRTDVITTGYTVDDHPTDGCGFHVVFDDVHACTDGTNKVVTHGGDAIAVEFFMKLDSDAKIGVEGNPNTSYLEFSNDPDVTDSTTTTPEDKVIVYTYELIVNKTDNLGQPVTGAKFQLYKYYKNAPSEPQEDGKVSSAIPVAVGEPQEGTPVYGADGKLQKVTFNWAGLDTGTYKLEETVVPDGFTKANDIYFKIEGTYDGTSENPVLTGLKVIPLGPELGQIPDGVDKPEFTINPTDGTVSTTIVNTSGTLLPSTGGIGTTLFYVLGSLLVIGAGVLLVSKKRMGFAD